MALVCPLPISNYSNITVLNSLTKRHRIVGWMKKKTQLYKPTRHSLQLQRHRWLKVKGWKRPCHTSGNHENGGSCTYSRQIRV